MTAGQRCLLRFKLARARLLSLQSTLSLYTRCGHGTHRDPGRLPSIRSQLQEADREVGAALEEWEALP